MIRLQGSHLVRLFLQQSFQRADTLPQEAKHFLRGPKFAKALLGQFSRRGQLNFQLAYHFDFPLGWTFGVVASGELIVGAKSLCNWELQLSCTSPYFVRDLMVAKSCTDKDYTVGLIIVNFYCQNDILRERLYFIVRAIITNDNCKYNCHAIDWVFCNRNYMYVPLENYSV